MDGTYSMMSDNEWFLLPQDRTSLLTIASLRITVDEIVRTLLLDLEHGFEAFRPEHRAPIICAAIITQWRYGTSVTYADLKRLGIYGEPCTKIIFFLRSRSIISDEKLTQVNFDKFNGAYTTVDFLTSILTKFNMTIISLPDTAACKHPRRQGRIEIIRHALGRMIEEAKM